MPQSVLVDKPVILSKHKRNVIAHEKPLSAIVYLKSFDPYVLKPDIKEKNGDTVSIKPSESFSEYQKSAHENLISINNNLSSMLQETCSGIDSICQKVRLCLMEANTIKASGNTQTLSRMGTCEQLNICEEETHSHEVLSIERVRQDQTNAELTDENVEDFEDD